MSSAEWRIGDMVFKPSSNITEQIADHLADQIILGHLKGGTRIQELKIANQLQVSRGSVREALLILERRHLIEIVPRKGAVVNELVAEEVLELVDVLRGIEQRWLHGLLNPVSAQEILPAAEMAVAAMEQGARADDAGAVIQARTDFYEALLTNANRYIKALFECMLPTSHRLLRRLIAQTEADVHDIARFYRALYAALDERNEERLDELLQAFHRRLVTLVGKAFESRVHTARLRRPTPLGATA